jgi:hypothetical protein
LGRAERDIPLRVARNTEAYLIKTWFAHTSAIFYKKNQRSEIVNEPQRLIGSEACLDFVARTANSMSK